MFGDELMQGTEGREGAAVDIGVVQCYTELLFECRDHCDDSHRIEFGNGAQQRRVVNQYVGARTEIQLLPKQFAQGMPRIHSALPVFRRLEGVWFEVVTPGRRSGRTIV